MKKLLRRSILLLASVLLLATAVFAGGWELVEMEPAEGYVVKKYEEYDWADEMGDPSISSEYTYELDEDNRIVAINIVSNFKTYDLSGEYTGLGVSKSRHTLEYDTRGNCVRESWWDESGKEAQRYEYIYDAYDRIIEEHTYFGKPNGADWSYESVMHHTYDEKGLLIAIEEVDGGTKETFEYDSEGNLLKHIEAYVYEDTILYCVVEYYEDGKIVKKDDQGIEWYYEYDATGKCVALYEVFSYNEYYEKTPVYKTDYIYDEHGNNIRADVDFGWTEDGASEYKSIFLFEYEYLGDEAEPEPEPEPEEVQFTDLVENSSYYDAVLWAVDKGITKGTSDTEFTPKEDCTRAQIVTFLWRYAGEPEPTSTEHNFVDLVEDSSYYKAVLWAVEKGITNGLDDTHFGPKEPCTRAQIVTFLWRADGKPEPSSQQHSFEDIVEGSSYYDAVLWAVEKGITTGADSTHFAPKDTCTRAQGMTFLYRYNNTK